MPPTNRPHSPRIVIYHQTHFKANGDFASLLPLVTESPDTLGVTHIIIAALHVNAQAGDITLNDDPPNAPRNEQLWEELAIFQDMGVKVLGMLGGAAKGTFQRLDGSDYEFGLYYPPLRNVIRRYAFNGLDLDVEEPMSLGGIIRLIDYLKADFGDSFLVTFAPVAFALQGMDHLSGFDYEALEVMRGHQVAWYNTQFYNNWGCLQSFADYDAILSRGWKPEKIVVGVLTNPGLGHGYVDYAELQRTVAALSQFYPGFGGIMG
ncbi:uncharacterized protein KY384_001612 [Bacidia gigantensis]|uniref:uncharacterized protein n=1 Tax=Bacidia gigantensis TaxID=2732470 RepID=UPI001D03FBC8|nr:uncharacterized protein KY384_001612 [Bacidia gigantensis]KAG8533871.1 hypothetical protein KY384_001612 [Bacidia gigantensis]